MLLSFGVAALLFLVTEELIAEAHEGEGGQSTLVCMFFFVGFLIALLLAKVQG